MQWFKHDTNSTMDFKIKKLIIKYGAIGYAIYFHCLELIASEISDNNITFELEHDSEIIADDLRIKGSEQQSGKELVEEIMRYMITLNLFEESEGHIFCFKLLKRLDTSMTSSTKLRALITKAKNQEQFIGLQEDKNSDKKQKNHDSVMTESGFNMQDKTRQDNTTQDNTTQDNTTQDNTTQDNTTQDNTTQDNTNNYSCLEQSEEKAEVEPLILNDGSEWLPTKSEYSEYLRLYPNVDIVSEFRRMRGWCNGNPKKRKTRHGITRFVNAWLGKEQDKPSCIQNRQQQNNKNVKKDLNDQDGWL